MYVTLRGLLLCVISFLIIRCSSLLPKQVLSIAFNLVYYVNPYSWAEYVRNSINAQQLRIELEKLKGEKIHSEIIRDVLYKENLELRKQFANRKPSNVFVGELISKYSADRMIVYSNFANLIKPGMLVTYYKQVIGQIESVISNFCYMRPIVHSEMYIGVIGEKSRAQCIVRGCRSGVKIYKKASLLNEFIEGERVFLDQIFSQKEQVERNTSYLVGHYHKEEVVLNIDWNAIRFVSIVW
mgnify:CR=1 FL=1